MNPPDISLPPAFLQRLTAILSPENYAQFLRVFNSERLTSFRINTLKISPDAVLGKLDLDVTPIDWCQNAYYVPTAQKRLLTQTSYFSEGEIYIQNASSLFASLALDPNPGEEILDLAAAPGGKTLHIADLMHNQGRIAAIEPVRDRFFKLRSNINLAGANIVATYCKDGSALWRVVPARFDRVLLDAPCSAEARFDPKDPKSFAFWSEKKILEMNRKQKKLIYSAIKCLKPGGSLIYCTCSYAPEENEAIIQYALDKFGKSIEVQPLAIPFDNYQTGLTHWHKEVFDESLVNTIRIIPNELMAGFYIAKLRVIPA
jgi:16S rRNA (cytosine1407-C5)-methyltransferase